MKYENVEVIDQDNYGRGISRINNKIVFIDGALPNDICDIELTQDKKNYSCAKVIKFIKTSRVESKCKYYELCGGCNLLHQDYNEQLNFKENKIVNLKNRYFKDQNIKINPIIYDDNYNYRNKIVLHLKKNKLGLYNNKSNDVIEINDCLLVESRINDIIKMIRECIKDKKCSDNEVLIRVSDKETLVSFINEIDIYLDVDTLIINNKVVKGNGYIVKEINDLKFKVGDKSFFQVNDLAVNKLYNEVINNIKDKNYKNVLDLYSGTGTITLLLSKYVRNITGIEIIKEAVSDANFNKNLNNISNTNFICGRVEDNIDKFANIDALVVDPPRSGLDKKTISNILRINSEMICYVSCDPNTLFRDLELLSSNYKIESLTPIDMFPNTFHVECVSVLHRKSL